jgi:hypothetical protein
MSLGGGRCDFLEVFALIFFSHYVGTQTLYGIQRVGHWFYTVGVNSSKLINQVENIAQIGLVFANLIVVDLQARQAGDFTYLILIQSHVVTPVNGVY